MSTATVEPTRLRDLKTGVRDMIFLDPRIIKVEPGHNPRNYELAENRAHLDELKGSIRAHGTQVPLMVRWEPSTKEAILVDGECRLRANLELIEEGVEIEGVPTFQVKAGDESQRLILALTANTGKPLSKWEIGAAFQKLINFGWSTEKIATQMGYAQRYVTESLELSDAPMEIKSLLSQQAVTPSLAIAHIRQNGSGAVMTLRAAVAQAKPGRNGKKTAKRAVKSTGIRLTTEEAQAVMAACEEASIQRDRKCGELGEAAIAILNAKGIKAK